MDENIDMKNYDVEELGVCIFLKVLRSPGFREILDLIFRNLTLSSHPRKTLHLKEYNMNGANRDRRFHIII